MTYPSVFETGPEGDRPIPSTFPDAASALDYVADMAGELSGLALGVGEAKVAELLTRAVELARERSDG